MEMWTALKDLPTSPQPHYYYYGEATLDRDEDSTNRRRRWPVSVTLSVEGTTRKSPLSVTFSFGLTRGASPPLIGVSGPPRGPGLG